MDRAAYIVGAAAACACVCLACEGAPAGDTATTTLPILEGTVTDLRPEVGSAFLQLPGKLRESCTGTFIGGRYFLTAAHCVHFRESNRAFYSVHLAGQNYGVTHIFNLGPAARGPDDPPMNDPYLETLFLRTHGIWNRTGNNDLAVLMLAGYPSLAPAALAPAAPAEDALVSAFGLGVYNLAGDHDGKKRVRSWSYKLRPDDATQRRFHQEPGGVQVIGSGDSGGPAVFGAPEENGAIWGVASSSALGWDWWADVPHWRDRILDILATGRHTRWFDAVAQDLADTGWPVPHVETALWAQAQRAAFGFCEKLGFVTGHLNGWQSPPATDLKGTWCFGPDVQIIAVNQAERDLAPFSFWDVNTIGWAHASRNAHILCFRSGMVGGQYNGHENTAGGVMGLACHASGAEELEASKDDLSAMGMPIADVDQVGWAQAARAAEGWCRQQPGGFQTGRFTGWQSSTTLGVVCHH